MRPKKRKARPQCQASPLPFPRKSSRAQSHRPIPSVSLARLGQSSRAEAINAPRCQKTTRSALGSHPVSAVSNLALRRPRHKPDVWRERKPAPPTRRRRPRRSPGPMQRGASSLSERVRVTVVSAFHPQWHPRVNKSGHPAQQLDNMIPEGLGVTNKHTQIELGATSKKPQAHPQPEHGGNGHWSLCCRA